MTYIQNKTALRRSDNVAETQQIANAIRQSGMLELMKEYLLRGKKKIDVEIDGTQHEIIGGMPVLEDVERDKFLSEKEGWKILRFSNHRILSEMPKVIQELLVELG